MNKKHYEYDELHWQAQQRALAFEPREDTMDYDTLQAVKRHLSERIHSIYPSVPPLIYCALNTPDNTDYITFEASFDLHSLLPGGEWEALIGEPIISDLSDYPELNRIHNESEQNKTDGIAAQTDVDPDEDPRLMTVSIHDPLGRISENHEEILRLEAHVLNRLRAYAEHLLKYPKLQVGTHIYSESLETWYRKNKTLFTEDGTPLNEDGTPFNYERYFTQPTVSLYEHMSAHPEVKAGRALLIAWEINDILELKGPHGPYPLTEEDAIQILRDIESNYDASEGITYDTLEDAVATYLAATPSNMLTGEVAVGRQHPSNDAGGWDTIEVQIPARDLHGLTELEVAAAFEKAAAEALEARGEPCVFLKLLNYNAENGI